MGLKYLLFGFLALTLGGHTILSAQNIDSTEVYYIVDVNPIFNVSDGPEEFNRWFASQLNYPEEAIKDSFEGRVIAYFVVDSTGSVTNPFFLDSIPKYIKNEIERILLNSPMWTPGFEKGKPVDVTLSIPVTFSLDAINKEEELKQPSKKKRKK